MEHMKARFERMLRSMAWADREILQALRDCPAAQEQGLPLLAHLLAAEHIWLSRITAGKRATPSGRNSISPVVRPWHRKTLRDI